MVLATGVSMPKLTKTFVDKLDLPTTSDTFHWDSEMPRFGLRVKPSGVKTFLIQYRNAEGKSKRKSIGKYGVLTPDEARQEARRLLAAVTMGDDPVSATKAQRAAPTVADLADRYLAEYARAHKKERSRLEDERIIVQTVKPALGDKKVAGVSRDEIAKLHHALQATPYAANRTLALLSKMFNLAEAWDLPTWDDIQILTAQLHRPPLLDEDPVGTDLPPLTRSSC